MRDRRDWDKVRNERKVEEKGAQPVHAVNWGPQSDLPVRAMHPLEPDLRSLVRYVILKTFVCNTYLIRPRSDLQEFANLNNLDLSSSQTQALFTETKAIFDADFETFASHLALSNPKAITDGPLDIASELNRLQRARKSPLRIQIAK